VEVSFSGVEGKEDLKFETASTGLKVLLPWMIKQGINLTKEQRGEVKEESKMDDSSAAAEPSDDKKISIENDDKIKKQREAEESAEKEQELLQTSISNGFSKSSSDRQVGMKSKREEDDEPYDDVEWKEAPIRGNTSEGFKVNNLNAEASASGEDDDDDID
ncbi:hypothetical protein H0E87_025998, partial [Populus deltoides]